MSIIYNDDEIRTMDRENCDDAIEFLRCLQNQCVGNLYPAIIEDEIQKIERRKKGEPINGLCC